MEQPLLGFDVHRNIGGILSDLFDQTLLKSVNDKLLQIWTNFIGKLQQLFNYRQIVELNAGELILELVNEDTQICACSCFYS